MAIQPDDSNSTNKIISIIVPVYKVEKYIKRCIDSIICQSNPNFELILIDDGSPDHSFEICEQHAKIDNRIKVFRKKNTGVSDTRNFGIQQAKGDWVCFIDSDDWVEPNYLSFNLENLNKDTLYYHNVVNDHSYDNEHPLSVNLPYIKKISVYDAIHQFKLLELGYPVAKLYNRSVLINNNIKFDEALSFHEDHVFVLEYLKHMKFVSFSGEVTYHYIKNSDGMSLSSKKHDSLEMLLGGEKLRTAIAEVCKINNISATSVLQSAYTGFGCRQMTIAMINANKNNYKKVFSYIRNNKKFIIKYYKPVHKQTWLLYLLIFLRVPSYFVFLLKNMIL